MYTIFFKDVGEQDNFLFVSFNEELDEIDIRIEI